MTGLFDRLLAKMKEPDRYAASVSEPWNVIDYKDGYETSQSNRAKARATAADLNARHRLASILQMIVEDEGALKAIAFAICRSGKFECGEGRCAVLCMDSLGNKPKECGLTLRIHGKLASAALSALLSILEKK